MATLKIIVYLMLSVIIIQTVRQVINVIKNKQFPNKCLNSKKIIKVSGTTTNTLIIGDDTIIGSKLFDCNDTIGKKLSDLLGSNVYQFGKSDLTLKGLYDFVKANWFDINSAKADHIVLCVGHNDVTSMQFDINGIYLDKTVKLLKTITDKIYLLSPRDIHNDEMYVFPFNYIIKQRENSLFMLINSVADDNNIKVIDIKKDISYLCKNGRYCRLSDNTSLDNDGITIVSNLIKNNLVSD